jgi:hypothetical protein
MTDFTAKIRAKGLDGTGVDENLAREMFTAKGKHYMAIVELKVDEIHEKVDGQRRVDLVITQVEPATSKDLDDHLRNITRTTYQNRALKSEDAQLQIETAEDLEPTVEQVIAAGQQHIAETDDALDLDTDDQDDEAGEQPTEEDWVDSQHGDQPEPEDEPWEYDEPEPTVATIPDPFAQPEPAA